MALAFKRKRMEHDIKIYAKGTDFEGGVYDLRSLETLISSYRSILDMLVSVQLGRRQLSNKIKSQLDYQVEIKEGSIQLLIDFALDHPELLMVLSQDGGQQISNVITKLFRDAINLRKAAASFIEKGLTFNIKITNSFNFGNNNVHINNENAEILIPDPKILWAAQATRFATDKILKKINGKSIEKVDLISNEESFSLKVTDRNILGRDKEALNAKLQIVGRLDMIAFSLHKGTIVSESEHFPVTWDDKIRSKMLKVADIDGVVFTVQPVIDHSRLNRDAIGFHVLECSNNNIELPL